jgi:hypothetical protein
MTSEEKHPQINTDKKFKNSKHEDTKARRHEGTEKKGVNIKNLRKD